MKPKDNWQEIDQKRHLFRKSLEDRYKWFRGNTDFSIGPGWFNIVENLCRKLDPIIRARFGSLVHEGKFHIPQIKEKFGGLRFYPSHATEEMHTLIGAAEVESTKTCEVCGQPGARRAGPWIYTECDEHAEGRPVLEWRFSTDSNTESGTPPDPTKSDG